MHENFWDSLLLSGGYPSLFLHFLFKFSGVVLVPSSCFMNLRVNKIFSYSGTQTFQTLSICSRSLIFQLSVFVLLLIPCLTLFYHSNSSWWIFRKCLHIKMSTFILSWWRNLCIMYMSFLLALLALLQSAEVNRLAMLQWLLFLLPGYLYLSFLLQV